MYSENVLLFAGGLVGTILVSLVLSFFVALKEPLSELRKHFSFKNLKVIGYALIASNIVNIFSFFQPMPMFTPVIHWIEGSSVVAFQYFTHPLLTVFFIFTYLVVYPVLMVLTYFKLHSLDNGSEMKYVGSYMLLIIVSAPFFYLLPVEVTGYYLPGVEPLLYEFHPIIYQGITTIDPLTKALPSLHTGMSVLAAIYAFKYTKNYRWPILGATLAVIVSTFYLGVHWFSDALLGAIMAFMTFYLVDRGIVTSKRVPDRVVDKVREFVENTPVLDKEKLEKI
ncbi:MAG: hypothetical protein BRC28_01145 [Nanohaloarchaea archaeon SW_4_43_9]|nr:MAG: hypothetical protein BRC28_01145 [Nanohaloarchaea archaeon SW_4_43_9]